MAGVERPTKNKTEKQTTNKENNKTTKVKSKTETKETEIKEVEVKKVETQLEKKPYDILENEVLELKEMIKGLLNSQNKSKEVILKTSEEVVQQEYVEIPLNKRIPVISLYDGILVLTTDKRGSGKPFEFKKFGTIIHINYSDLVEILHYQRRFAEEGLFYINDKNVISNNGLQDVYKNILDKKMIDNILSLNKSELNEVFNNTTEAQRDIIVSIIINKIRNNEDIDLNKVDMLSKIYKRDIIDIANEGIFKEENEE
jgi:hypothetical protein